MAKKVVWTPKAEATFEVVIAYLEEYWTEKETENFIHATNKIVRQISEHPNMFRKIEKIGLHEALITKHNLLLYRIKEEKIDLITFWDTRRNPKKKHKGKK